MNCPAWVALAGGLALAAGLMSATWVVSLVRRDASLADRVWGLGFVALGWWYFAVSGAGHWLAAVLTTLWGLRLSAYITRRNWGHGEDARYAAMRAGRRRFALFSLIAVFLLQAALQWLVAFPLFAAARAVPRGPAEWAATGAGIALWLAGFVFEALGDWQLARFKADAANRGRVFDRGLWRYTRHPNYFGDMLVWWGLFLVAAGAGGWWTVFAPLLMSGLLARVSGVTLLENRLRASKPGYEAYVRRTSALFPWPPKRG